MAAKAPSMPRGDLPATVDSDKLLQHFAGALEEMHRHTSAGYINVPCVAEGTENEISLVVFLHKNGADNYDNGRSFSAKAAFTSTGPVTAYVTTRENRRPLPTLKVYIDNGREQADDGDIVEDRVYRFTYEDTLDGGAGGFVVNARKGPSEAIPDVSGGTTIDTEARAAVNAILAFLRDREHIET